MATSDRQTARDLADDLLADARNHSFFRLLERLHHLYDDNLEGAASERIRRRRLRLQSSPSLRFPASDVVATERLGDTDRYRIQTSFFGMHGADSPLPGYYLDLAAYEQAQGQGIRPAFLDFFNHRVLELLHQAWRKYRYYLRFRPEANDRFSRYVFALIGLNDEGLRGTTPLPWSRLFSYAGIVAGRSRAPATVAGIVAHCFDLDDVTVREFEVRTVVIDPAQRNALGSCTCMLGECFYVGGSTQTCSSKFTLVISNLGQQRFREFLPGASDHSRLCKLVEFLLRDITAYDLELRMKREEVPPFSLRREQGTHIGWTSFIDQRADHAAPAVRIKVRS